MLHWQNRLRQRKVINRVYRQGKHRRTPNFRLQLLKRTSGATKVAIVVSTKVAKKATARNRLRRRVRGVVAELLPTISESCDLVITITDTQIADIGAEELKTELSQGLASLGA